VTAVSPSPIPSRLPTQPAQLVTLYGENLGRLDIRVTFGTEYQAYVGRQLPCLVAPGSGNDTHLGTIESMLEWDDKVFSKTE
jgi:hypothetical protein